MMPFPDHSASSSARPQPRPGPSVEQEVIDVDDPAAPPGALQKAHDLNAELQEKLEHALSVQKDLMEAQKQAKASLAAPMKLVRDANNFVETYMANISEDTARTYSIEVLKLATGLVSYEEKQLAFRPKVICHPSAEPTSSSSASASVRTFSPLTTQQQQQHPPHPPPPRPPRSSWGGETPSYGRPHAHAVQQGPLHSDDPTYSYMRDFQYDGASP